MKHIAIIGAGISGLVLARNLSELARVTVFEKARGVGGRMSTRYADAFCFDHGAQCFTARTQEFQRFLVPYQASGVVAQWQGKAINLEKGKPESLRVWEEPHLVASPNMNSLCKALAAGLDVRTSCEVTPLSSRSDEGWVLHEKEGTQIGIFDWVISTAPPVQSVRLFDAYLSADNRLRHVTLKGCYALMLGFHAPWHKDWIAAKVRDNPLKWISVNSTKPGRNGAVTCIVAHSRSDWAEEHIDDDVQQAQSFLVQQFEDVTGIDCNKADYVSTHRWRYAIVEQTSKSGCYIDSALQLAASSDWCQTSRIEEVWEHAQKLSQELYRALAV